MALGASIGAEREAADKPAGLRTHILVAGAAALLVDLGEVAVERFTTGGLASVVQADPIRILEAIITGFER
jgi:putative Mg2+ transporter-C (MgtC) family protein